MEVKNSFVISIQFGKYPSTLLIPGKLGFLFYSKLEEFGNMKLYLCYLVERYSKRIQALDIKKISSYTRKYQEKGQNLNRYNFRPRQSDWTKLRFLASMWGVSMASMFVMLMLLDYEDGEPNQRYVDVGVPTNSLTFKSQLYSTFYTASLNYRKILLFPRPPSNVVTL